MGIVVWIVVVAVFLGLAILIFTLMRRGRGVVPAAADRLAADRVVAVDDQGRPVTASEEGEEAEPRDAEPFEDILDKELKDLRG